MTLTFELLILILVRCFRQSDFRQYTAALMAITPWMFALDRTNYSRWLPVHIRDMVGLPNKHPHVFKEFSTSGGKIYSAEDDQYFFFYTTRPGSRTE